MRFKVGDKVIGNTEASVHYATTREGFKGVVVEVAGSCIVIRGEDLEGYIVNPEFFDLIVEGKEVDNMNEIAQKLLDEETKMLIEAGLLDSRLELTSKGTIFLLARYLAENKKLIAAEAKKIVAESKKG